jgi:hypothetical protein
MTTYEAISLMLLFGSLIIALISYLDRDFIPLRIIQFLSG